MDRNAADQAVEEYLEDGIEHDGDVMRVTWAYGKPKGPKQEFTFEIDEAKFEPQSKKSKPPTVLPLPAQLVSNMLPWILINWNSCTEIVTVNHDSKIMKLVIHILHN